MLSTRQLESVNNNLLAPTAAAQHWAAAVASCSQSVVSQALENLNLLCRAGCCTSSTRTLLHNCFCTLHHFQEHRDLLSVSFSGCLQLVTTL
jgi:hypothetical protein